jgi:type VI secretion system protein ImpG
MGDELLPYYNRELSYIRREAADFARDHPKIAKRLRISPDAIEDPHVTRLIEAYAYLNARIRYKLDDDYPELTDALMGVLYPHYLAPIPSTAVVQLRAAADLTSPYLLPAAFAPATR